MGVFVDADYEEVNDSANEPEIDIELLKSYSYINLMKIDGLIHDSEKELVSELLEHSLLDSHTISGMMSKFNSKELIKVDYSAFKDNPEQAVDLITNLIKIAKIDDKIDITEK